MNKEKEIELFRRNNLPEYIKLAKEKEDNNITCYQCGVNQAPENFYYISKINNRGLCKVCANKNYKEAELKRAELFTTNERNEFILKNRLKMTVPEMSEALKIPKRHIYNYFRSRKLEYKKIHTDNLNKFTPQEKKVFELLSKGLSNKEIQKELVIEKTTLNYHLVQIYQKLGLGSQSGVRGDSSIRVKAALMYLEDKDMKMVSAQIN